MPQERRPRERLLRRGARSLREEELLAAVLRTGYAGASALALARRLLREHPDGGLARLPPRELGRLKGMGLSRACSLTAALELGRRWSGDDADGLPVEGPESVWALLQPLPTERQERFVALYLDARNRLLGRETVSLGTLTASLVHPREVFAPAVGLRAAVVVVAHNHPSGSLVPSEEDLLVTRRLVRAGRLLGIRLADHVLVARDGFASLKEMGWLRA